MGSAPTPPSPTAGIGPGKQVGNLQQQYNVASQAGSMVGQANPYGTLSYYQSGTGPGGVPLYTAQTNLSPQQQQLLNTMTGTQMLAGTGGFNLLGGADYGAQPPTQAIGDLTGGITNQIMGNELGFLTPFFNQQTQQQEAQLANQGFQPGTTSWNNAMFPMLTGQGLTAANFLAQVQPQAMQQAMQEYMLPMTMAESMAQFGAPQMPGGQFVQTPQLGSVNEIGAYQAAQQAAEQQYQAQMQQYSGMMGGLFGIPTALLGGMAQAGAFGGAGAAAAPLMFGI